MEESESGPDNLRGDLLDLGGGDRARGLVGGVEVTTATEQLIRPQLAQYFIV